ncbi:HAD-IA family hydrolase [Pseudonocardia sp.]|uniref:HAD family hydrolase n=1 Tax=Pseudonocardia sp. TaxID=60912 RepID=UPI0026037826|nr:HAD-IA family hydrolase [Pseudonocardia sp.]
MARALLLDLGGTVFRSGSEMMALLGEAHPEAAAVAARRGPLGPEPDELWDRMIRSEITERDYWQRRCDEVGAALGRDWPIQEFMHTLYALVGDDIVRPEAAALIADARAAGIAVGVLTNDLRAFHGETGMAAHPVLDGIDAFVDGSLTGVLKPDPRAYAIAVEQLGREPGDIVFVDDMPWNITGARRAGMIAVEVDLTDPAAAFARARTELSLTEEAA